MTKDEALKQALEAGYKDLPTVRLAYQGFDIQHFTNLVIAAERHRVLAEERAALAQAEQEPCKGKNCGSTNPKLHSAECFDEHEFTVLNIKPFGYFEFVFDDGDGYWREIEDGGIDGKPLYTAPPQRQPLTEEKQIAEDLRFHGLQLVKTVTGYAVLKLGQVAAHGIGDKT